MGRWSHIGQGRLPRRDGRNSRRLTGCSAWGTTERWLRDPEGVWREQAGLVDSPSAAARPRRQPAAALPVVPRCHLEQLLQRAGPARRQGHCRPHRADLPLRDEGGAEVFTCAGLLEEVAAFGGTLTALGVKNGDRVVIYTSASWFPDWWAQFGGAVEMWMLDVDGQRWVVQSRCHTSCSRKTSTR